MLLLTTWTYNPQTLLHHFFSPFLILSIYMSNSYYLQFYLIFFNKYTKKLDYFEREFFEETSIGFDVFNSLVVNHKRL